MTLEKGKIVKIEGGSDAYLLQGAISTAMATTAPIASPTPAGERTSAPTGAISAWTPESKYGTVLVAIGRNVFDAPAPNCGLGGRNTSTAHCDICCRNTSFWLDGRLIVENEQFMVPDLR